MRHFLRLAAVLLAPRALAPRAFTPRVFTRRAFAPPVFTLLAFASLALAPTAFAQAPGGPPPAVGVVTVEPTSITETWDFVGRVQAPERVALTARVTAFLQQRLFVEGTDVKAGDLLYKLERGSFEADVSRQEAASADMSARLGNATIQLERAETLLKTSGVSVGLEP